MKHNLEIYNKEIEGKNTQLREEHIKLEKEALHYTSILQTTQEEHSKLEAQIAQLGNSNSELQTQKKRFKEEKVILEEHIKELHNQVNLLAETAGTSNSEQIKLETYNTNNTNLVSKINFAVIFIIIWITIIAHFFIPYIRIQIPTS